MLHFAIEEYPSDDSNIIAERNFTPHTEEKAINSKDPSAPNFSPATSTEIISGNLWTEGRQEKGSQDTRDRRQETLSTQHRQKLARTNSTVLCTPLGTTFPFVIIDKAPIIEIK